MVLMWACQSSTGLNSPMSCGGVSSCAVDRAGGIQRLQMGQEAGGQVAVPAAPFLDNECGGKVGLFGCVVAEVNGQRVRQAIIGARHRLVVVPDPAPAEPVEEGIDVGLPVVHRLELADELRGRLFVRRQGGNDAHNAAGFYRRLRAKGKEGQPFPLTGRRRFD